MRKNKQGRILGYLYENAVAQILSAKGNSLFYHTFSTQFRQSAEQIPQIY